MINLRLKRFANGNVVSKNVAKVRIILRTSKLFRIFLVTLALPKVLSFGKPQKYLAFRSLIRTFAAKFAKDGNKESRIHYQCTDGVDVSEGYKARICLYRTFECGEVKPDQYAYQQ